MADRPVDPAFARAMVVLAESVGGRLSESCIRVYWGLLSDMPIADFERAAYRCAREREVRFQPADPFARIPPVSEIRAYAVQAPQDAAILAWAGLNLAARTVGAYASLETADGCTSSALLRVFGSWRRFCETDDGPELAIKRQEFLAAFRAARLDPPPPVRLAGICEASGTYVGGAHVFVGLLGADGRVVVRRDTPRQVVAGPPTAELPEAAE